MLASTTFFSFLENLAKTVTGSPKKRNLFCDSKNPKVCYCCHLMRDTLIGRPIRNAKENPVVVFTKHGAYRIATKQFDDVDIKTKKNLVVTTFKFE